MSFHHKQEEQVRTYLLGTMPGPEARAFEERYFMDRAFFLWVQAVEVGLIKDYLNGKLPAEKVRIFESRYLHAAPLRAKIEEVREKQGQRTNIPRPSRVLRWAPLGAVVLACFGAGLYWVAVRWKSHPRTAVQVARKVPPSIHVGLLPGVQQGGNSMMAEMQIPETQTPIEFDLEVPGRAAAFQCSAAISEIEADGGLHRIWASPVKLSSTPKGNSQEVVFQVDSTLFHHGDYRIDLEMSDGARAGAYIFRAIPASPQSERQSTRHE